MDHRDGRTWVVIELTRAGEQRVEDGTLPQSLREVLSVSEDHPVFMPSAVYERAGKRTAVHLMEGYAFIASGLPETAYFNLERESPYVKKVLSIDGPSGLRTLSTLPDTAVQELREKLQGHVATDLEVGMRVRVIEGTFSNLDATVCWIEGEDAHVLIDELRSLKIITRVPKVFLDPSDEWDA